MTTWRPEKNSWAPPGRSNEASHSIDEVANPHTLKGQNISAQGKASEAAAPGTSTQYKAPLPARSGEREGVRGAGSPLKSQIPNPESALAAP
jgi:hypothetical protein